MSQIDIACEVELRRDVEGHPRGTIGTVESVSGHSLTGPSYRVRLTEGPDGKRLDPEETIWVDDGAVTRA